MRCSISALYGSWAARLTGASWDCQLLATLPALAAVVSFNLSINQRGSTRGPVFYASKTPARVAGEFLGLWNIDVFTIEYRCDTAIAHIIEGAATINVFILLQSLRQIGTIRIRKALMHQTELQQIGLDAN